MFRFGTGQGGGRLCRNPALFHFLTSTGGCRLRGFAEPFRFFTPAGRRRFRGDALVFSRLPLALGLAGPLRGSFRLAHQLLTLRRVLGFEASPFLFEPFAIRLPRALSGFLRLTLQPLACSGFLRLPGACRCGLRFAQQTLALGGLLGLHTELFLLVAFTLRNPGSLGGFFGLANQPLALGRLRLLAQTHLVLQPFTLGLHPLAFGLRGALGDEGGFAEQSLTFGCFFGPKPLLFLVELLARFFNLALCRGFRFAQQPLAFGGRLHFESAPLLLGSLAFLPTGALGREFRFLHQALALGGFFLPDPALLFLELPARLFYLPLRRGFRLTHQPLALGRRLEFQLAPLRPRLAAAPLRGRGRGRLPPHAPPPHSLHCVCARLPPGAALFFVESHPLALACASLLLAQALALHLMALALEFLFLRFVAQPDEARRIRLGDRRCRRRLDRRRLRCLTGLPGKGVDWTLGCLCCGRLSAERHQSVGPRRNFDLGFLRSQDITADFSRVHRGIAGRENLLLFLFAAETPEQPGAGVLLLAAGCRHHRDVVRLHVIGPFDQAQVLQQVFFITRRQQRRQEQDVRHPRRDGGDGGVARIHDVKLGMYLFSNEVAEKRCLLVV